LIERPLDNGFDPQSAGDLRQRRLRGLIPHDGGTRDDTLEGSDLRDASDQGFGECVGFRIVFWVARQIGEGENSDGSDGRGAVGKKEPEGDGGEGG
jgi:hypothetical protein